MKKNILLIVVLLCLSFVAVNAQAKKDARDLYLEKSQPGAKLTLILNRKGKISSVPFKTVFQSGDKVAFKFATNFAAFVAVMTKGSSGKRKLLFPYNGAKDRISAGEIFRIPTGENWFVFDDTPGREELVFVMSNKPIAELAQANQASPAANSSAPPPPAAATASTPSGNTTAKNDEQEILAALNSRALKRGRDLYLEDKSGDAYVTTSPEQLSQPIAIPLILKHK